MARQDVETLNEDLSKHLSPTSGKYRSPGLLLFSVEALESLPQSPNCNSGSLIVPPVFTWTDQLEYL